MHGGTFCPSLLELHNFPCTAYGAGGFHRFLLGCKIKPGVREAVRKSEIAHAADGTGRDTNTARDSRRSHTPTQLTKPYIHPLICFLTELLVIQLVQTSYYHRAGLCVCACHPRLALDSRKSAHSFLTHAQMSAHPTVPTPQHISTPLISFNHCSYLFSDRKDKPGNVNFSQFSLCQEKLSFEVLPFYSSVSQEN